MIPKIFSHIDFRSALLLYKNNTNVHTYFTFMVNNIFFNIKQQICIELSPKYNNSNFYILVEGLNGYDCKINPSLEQIEKVYDLL